MPTKKHRHEFWVDLFANRLPRAHLFAAVAVAVSLVVLLVLAPSEPVSAFKEKNLAGLTPDTETQLSANLDSAIVAVSSRPSRPAYIQLDERVRKGDNLSTIFNRMELDQREVHALANANGYADEFRNLRPGETLTVLLTSDHNVYEVIYERSKLESFRYTPSEDGYTGEKLTRTAKPVIKFRNITIDHSLFVDAGRAGLSASQIMHIANIFAWDIDFALDIRKGDTFSVLFEEDYIDGEKVGNGNILSAEFTNQGQTFSAVRYVNGNGDANYYTPDGRPMKKAFLRAPLDFTRVSSNYNPNRLHPIFGTKRPHRGVDYAAPTGTPVYAAGDGKVIASGYSKGNGNYVVIQHGGAYTTKYLHLQKRLVKTGQAVRQSQAIGAVGSTGYATGPHLHYEFLVNGTHKNPRTVKLPQADPIARSEMEHFRQQTAPLMAELNDYRASIAQASTSPTANKTL